MRGARFALGILVIGALIGAWYVSQTPTGQFRDANDDLTVVRERAESFGAYLRMVPLLADASVRNAAMDQYYQGFVAPELLERWKAQSSGVPGRFTSSPAPERILISGVSLDASHARVEGEVVETTSTGESGRYPVRIDFELRKGIWLITNFTGYPPPVTHTS